MLKHGILGLLNYGDMTGYEIREAFNSSLNYFWNAQTSQIYRELNELEKNGWIVKNNVVQVGKPNKNVCTITSSGKAEFLRWLLEDNIPCESRSPLLMKIFFMGELSKENALDFFKKLNTSSTVNEKMLDSTDNSINFYKQYVPDEKCSIFWQMTADFGKRYNKMLAEWSQNCIDILNNEG